jgi:hypothetical protein
VKKRTVIVSSVMLGLSLMQLYSLRQASEAMTLNSFDLQVGKSKIHVNVEGRLNISQRQLQSYIEDASRAVIKYYGRLPLVANSHQRHSNAWRYGGFCYCNL